MWKRKRLFDLAKQSEREEDWSAYRKARNCVNQMLEVAHSAYVSQLLDESLHTETPSASGPTYIKGLCRDNSGVSMHTTL